MHLGKTIKLQMHTKAVTGKLSRSGGWRDRCAVSARSCARAFQNYTAEPGYDRARELAKGRERYSLSAAAGPLEDVVGIVKSEVRALADDGASYLQFDEGFTIYGEAGGHEQLRAAGEDPEKTLLADIAAENACYDAVHRPASRWQCIFAAAAAPALRAGLYSYDGLRERLFGELHVDRFLLEYDSDRVGSFRAVAASPQRQGRVVIGLVSSTNPELETRDAL